MAGLDPAIHPLRKRLLEDGWMRGSSPRMTQMCEIRGQRQTMQFWIIQGLNSLSLGGLLFLLSSGFSLIFGLMRLANLTHGAFFMLGTYFAATAMRAYGDLSIWTMAVWGGVAVAAIGGLFE